MEENLYASKQNQTPEAIIISKSISILMETKKTKVIVIGAGLSGLSAAEKLLKDGHSQVQVTVLQSMERVGGRTQTIDINGAKFDLGGQWVGKTQTYVQALAERAGNELIPQYHQGQKILHFGSTVSTYRSNIPLNVGILPLIQMQINIWKLDRMASKLNAENPREGNPMAVLWDSLTVQAWIQSNISYRNVRLLMQCAVRAVLGVETNEVSFLFFLWYIRQNGGVENLINIENGLQEKKMVKGSQHLSQFLKANIEGMGGKVLLGSPVQKVTYLPRLQQYEVKFGTTGEVKCDYIIIAMPPARVTRIEFEPQLSRERRLICDRNFMGSISKVHLLYDEAHWRATGFSGQTLSDCVETPIFNAYDDTKTKENGEVQPAILVFINADVDREWSSVQNRPAAEKNILSTLAKYFKSEKMLAPSSIHWKSWNQEPSLGGGPIAVFPPGVLTKIKDIRKSQGKIHWAGTQMARRSQGFMDGAIESGLRAADEVLAGIRDGKQEEEERESEVSGVKSKCYCLIVGAKPRWLEWL